MQGLMLKLLNVDADGERALRVVAYFDELLLHRPDLESVVRATAILADCTAGLRLPGGSAPLAFTRDGLLSDARESSAVSGLDIDVEDVGGRPARAWLVREGSAGDLDAFILERMALVVASVLERQRRVRFADSPIGLADPALATLLVNERASEADRTRAASLMGIAVPGRVRALAIASDERTPVVPAVARTALGRATGRPVHTAAMANDLVLCLIAGEDAADLSQPPLPARIGIGPAVEVLDAPASWESARRTLRFAGLGAAWATCLRSTQVGGLSMLLGLDRRQVLADADVQAIDHLAHAAGGEDAVTILDHVLHAESLRSAARNASFHHSSVQSRVPRIEAALGIDLRDAVGRQRAAHALLLWQLHVRDAVPAAG